jgi:hypothetical protein
MRFIVFLFLCLATAAQGQQRFYKLYAGNGFDKGEDVLVLPDSSYVVAGSSGSFEETAQGYLLKLDQQGNYQWSQAYGAQETEEVKRVFYRPGLGYYMAGMSNSWSAGTFDPMLIYTDLAGNQQWIKTYESPSWERIHDGVQTIDTGMVLVGERQAVFGGSADVLVLHLDKNGDTLWTKSFGTAGDDRAFAIQRLSDTTYAIGGEWYVADSSEAKAFIAVFNANGNILWQQTFGHFAGAYQVSDLTITPDGIMFAGSHRVSSSNYDNFSGTITTAGVMLQEITHLDNPTTIENNRICQAQYIAQQNLSVFGFQIINSSTFQDNYDLIFGYVDPYFGYWMASMSGTVILNEGLDQISQIRATPDGGYVAVGTNSNVVDNQNALNGGSNIYVLKIDVLGGGEIQTDTVFTLNQLVGLHEAFQGSQNFGVYPNPTADLVTITAFSDIPLAFTLTDNQGRVLEQFDMQACHLLDLQQFPAGVYYLNALGQRTKLLKY